MQQVEGGQAPWGLAGLDGRAHPDGEEPLDDDWVFADLWRRLCIAYLAATAEQWDTFPAAQLATIDVPPFTGDTVFD